MTADRFRPTCSLSDAELEERTHRYHCENIGAKELRPLLKQRFRPVLKRCGFRRATESLSFRTSHAPYVHFLSLSFSSVFPGRFFVKAGITLDFLPLSGNAPFVAKKVNLDADGLFTTQLMLSNGNSEFDNGRNESEANETIDLLLEAFSQFEKSYFVKHFTSFPTPIDQLGVPFVKDLTELVANNEESEYGTWGATDKLFVYRLSLIHKQLGNFPAALALVQHGLSNYTLRGLQPQYDALSSELQSLAGSQTA